MEKLKPILVYKQLRSFDVRLTSLSSIYKFLHNNDNINAPKNASDDTYFRPALVCRTIPAF